MKTNLDIAEEALAKWSPQSLGLLRTAVRDDLMLPAIADARDTGFKEAIELIVEKFDAICFSAGISVDLNTSVVATLRKLAPAATTEEP